MHDTEQEELLKYHAAATLDDGAEGAEITEQEPLRCEDELEAGPPANASALPSISSVTVVAVSLLILVVDMVAIAPTAPRMVIFENIICRNHYGAWQAGGVGLLDCKVAAVQSELALIDGWRTTFDTIPGLLVSTPYGILANRIGRGKVLVLALIGCLLSDAWVATVCLLPRIVPLRAIWLSGLFQLIGGGGASVVSMCFTMIGDTCSPEQRTTAFSLVHAAILLSELVAIPLGSALIAVNPWIPILSAIALMIVVTIAALLFSSRFDPPPTHIQQNELEETPLMPCLPRSGEMRALLGESATKLAAATTWITRDVLLMLVAFFFVQMSRQSAHVLLQYSAYRFHWSYAKASYLMVLRAAVNLTVLMAFIPALTRYFMKQRCLSQTRTDQYITIASGVCLMIGSIFIFLSETPMILILGQIFIGLGFAFTVTARSFLTTMTDAHHLSILYSGVASVTYGGVIVGGPLLAGLFQWGLHLEQGWVGVPFLLTAIMFAAATVAVSAAKGGFGRISVP